MYTLSKKYWRWLCLGCLSCILHILSYSQLPGFSGFLKINEDNGLSDNNVSCIFKDRLGYLWVGTASGLNLLDGSGITVFKNQPGVHHSLSNNYINCITQDSTGYLWIGTKNGVSLLNPLQRIFSNPQSYNASKYEGEEISGIAVDKNNNVFIAGGSGLHYFNRKQNQTILLDIPGDSIDKINNNRISHIAFDKKGILWISTFNGVWTYNQDENVFTQIISSKNDPHYSGLYTTFIFDQTGNVWLGTWNEGLKKYDIQTNFVQTFQQYPFNNNISSLAEISSPSGENLIMVNNNLSYFDIQKNKFIPFIQPNVSANGFLYSKDDLLWVGTQTGLYYRRLFGNLFRLKQFDASITNQNTTILEMNHDILIGGEGRHFLKTYDSNLIEKKDYGNDVLLRDINCLSLQPNGKDKVAVGTNKGILLFNLKTKTKNFYKLKDSSANISQLNFISSLLKDSYGEWWIFPWRNGIWISDSNFSNIHKLFRGFLQNRNIPKQLVISGACEDKNGNIWMSDYDEGIILFDRKKKQFSKPFVDSLGERNGCSQILYYKNYCFSINKSSLLMWNVENPILHAINFSQITDREITSFAIDSSGNLWMTTMNGLLSYNIAGKIFLRFTTADGMPTNRLDGPLYCCKDGTMILSNQNFIVSFNPHKLLLSVSEQPENLLTEVIINGQSVSFNENNQNEFTYNKNNFVFRWTITDFKDPLNNNYYYKLEGIDKNWRYVGKSGKVEFANLSPGKYTLLLWGKNANGVDAAKILKLQFNISFPFWRSEWFLGLLVLGIALFFYGLYRYRLNHVRKLTLLRNEISLNLHDDIGSTLSSISILSSIALSQEKDKKNQSMLEEIKDNSIAMMEKMDDIVWSINPKNDNLQNLLLRIRTFAGKLFEAKKIHYQIDFKENMNGVRMKMDERQHLHLIMKEAINNLIKYAACTEAGISASFTSSVLLIKIWDNGIGFDNNAQTNGNGLMNMKKRANALGAVLDIQSQANKGTTISLKLKIK
ncbi:MAG: hypothetical protein JST23_00645 [Bacteroidetes bacterium]|nr:hypothetical protein [Bacteroidota bacterium]